MIKYVIAIAAGGAIVYLWNKRSCGCHATATPEAAPTADASAAMLATRRDGGALFNDSAASSGAATADCVGCAATGSPLNLATAPTSSVSAPSATLGAKIATVPDRAGSTLTNPTAPTGGVRLPALSTSIRRFVGA